MAPSAAAAPLASAGTAAFFAVVFLALFFLFGPPAVRLVAWPGVRSLRRKDRLAHPGPHPPPAERRCSRHHRQSRHHRRRGQPAASPPRATRTPPALLYRHEEGEPYRKRFLQPDESSKEWAATVGPLDVSNGFTYKVAAGDAETPEYRVSVRAAPLISEFLATYHYRDYSTAPTTRRTERKLEDYRGTLVTITARTNRVLKDGRLDFDGADGVGDLIRPEPVPNEPQVLRFRMVLDRSGKYRLRFTSIEGEAYIETTSSDVVVIPDLPPQVRLTEPAKDVTLPANGQLELKGDATDDFGIARLTLRLHIVGGGKLKSKPYMADKLGQPNFGTPRVVEYHDLLDLPSLKDAHGKPADLKPGTEIEYWLEAADACDYPRPNVTASRPRYKIKIAEPEDAAKQQKQREEAQKRQKQHEAQQAEQIKQEKAGRAEQRARKKRRKKRTPTSEKRRGPRGKTTRRTRAPSRRSQPTRARTGRRTKTLATQPRNWNGRWRRRTTKRKSAARVAAARTIGPGRARTMARRSPEKKKARTASPARRKRAAARTARTRRARRKRVASPAIRARRGRKASPTRRTRKARGSRARTRGERAANSLARGKQVRLRNRSRGKARGRGRASPPRKPARGNRKAIRNPATAFARERDGVRPANQPT